MSRAHEARDDDAHRFQAWIHERQHPRDCHSTLGYYVVQSNIHQLGHGLGAQLVSMKFALAEALAMRAHVVYTAAARCEYTNPITCPNRSFTCYFERPTNCSTARGTHRRYIAAAASWCKPMPRAILAARAGLRYAHDESWYHAQLAVYLFRPSASLRSLVSEIGSDAGDQLAATTMHHTTSTHAHRGSGRGSHRATSGTSAGAGCAAMHVRRTDKVKEDAKAQTRGFDVYAKLLRTWARWHTLGDDTPTRGVGVMLGSEDPATFKAMPQLIAPHQAYWIPSRFFVLGYNSTHRYANNTQATKSMQNLYAAAAAKQLLPTAADAPPDEGATLIAQMILMSECRHARHLPTSPILPCPPYILSP